MLLISAPNKIIYIQTYIHIIIRIIFDKLPYILVNPLKISTYTENSNDEIYHPTDEKSAPGIWYFNPIFLFETILYKKAKIKNNMKIVNRNLSFNIYEVISVKSLNFPFIIYPLKKCLYKINFTNVYLHLIWFMTKFIKNIKRICKIYYNY